MLAFFLREINWQQVVATKWGHLRMSYYDLVSWFSRIHSLFILILNHYWRMNMLSSITIEVWSDFSQFYFHAIGKHKPF